MIENAIQIICVYAIPLIFAITLHEAAHGWAAKKLGDDTAWILGRVTANPVPHIDPVGTVLVPGALVLMSALTGGAGFVFGWAKPVPINPRYFRHFNRDMMLTALAGPASNLLQAIGWAVVLKLVVMLGISERFVISVFSRPSGKRAARRLRSAQDPSLVMRTSSLRTSRAAWTFSRVRAPTGMRPAPCVPCPARSRRFPRISRPSGASFRVAVDTFSNSLSTFTRIGRRARRGFVADFHD